MKIIRKAINKSKGVEDFLFDGTTYSIIVDKLSKYKESQLDDILSNKSNKELLLSQIGNYQSLVNLSDKFDNVDINNENYLIYLNKNEGRVVQDALITSKATMLEEITALRDTNFMSDMCDKVSIINLTIKELEYCFNFSNKEEEDKDDYIQFNERDIEIL